MKRLIILICLITNFSFSSEIKLSLRDFANLVSENNRISIIVSSTASKGDYFFYTSNNKSFLTLNHFKKVIEDKGLELVKFDNFYFVDVPRKKEPVISFDKDEIESNEIRYLKLKNNSFADASKIVNLSTDSNASYISSSNSIAFKASDKKYKKILKFINASDVSAKQIKFKLSILETSFKKLKDLGGNLNGLLKPFNRGDFKYYINLITMPYNTSSNVLNSQKSGFYGILNFLEQEGVTEVKSSPFLTAKNNTEVFFSSVENIPYLISNSKYEDAKTQVSNSYDYKDVGLKIKILPTILKDSVDFKIDLIFEDILENEKQMPITSKKELRSSYILKKGELLVLSGINKQRTINKRNGVPFLKDIPLIKYLFSANFKEVQKSVLTLTIEVI